MSPSPGSLGSRRHNQKWRPLLDLREEVVAEERRVGMHPGEALAEVRKKSHARHGIWSKIQKMEAVGVHDVIEEIREGGQRPQEK